MYLEVLSASKFMSYFMCSYKIIRCTSGVSSTQYFHLRYFVYHEKQQWSTISLLSDCEPAISCTMNVNVHIIRAVLTKHFPKHLNFVVTESMRAFQSRVCEDGQTAWICKINRFIGYVSVHTQYLSFFKTLLYARCNTHTILYNVD